MDALATLASRLRPVMSRRASVALALYGDPGIGKTHVARHLLSNATCRAQWLHAATSPSELVRLLPMPDRLARWTQRPLESVMRDEEPGDPRHADALAAFLAAHAPILIVVDDLHEAQPEAMRLWYAIADRVVTSRGVGLLVTSRRSLTKPFSLERVEALDPGASSRILGAELGGPLPEAASAWIYERANGNPLFTLEYARFLVRRGYLWNDGRRWQWRRPDKELLPLSIEALLELQLDVLGEDERLLAAARSKALLGRHVPLSLWAEVSGTDEASVSAAARDLERKEVLRDGEFAHPLYREVILRDLPRDVRRSLARRAVAAAPDPESAAEFASDAGMDPAERSALLERAAAHARSRNRTGAAARYLIDAAEVAPADRAAELLREAARALEGIDYERMLVVAERAASLTANPVEEEHLAAIALSVLGRYDELRELLDRNADAYRRSAEGFRRHLLLLHNASRSEDVVALWEASPHWQTTSDGITRYQVASAYIACARLDDAEAVARVALTKTELTPDEQADLYDLRARLCFYRGDYRGAAEVFDTGLESCGQARPQKRANLLRNRAVTYIQLGEHKASLPDFEAALDIYEEAGNRLHIAQTHVMASYVHLECGEYDRTEEVLREALEEFRSIAPHPFHVFALAQLVELYTVWPNSSRVHLAWKHAQEAIRVQRLTGDAESGVVAALARARAARPDESLPRAEEALATAVSFGGMPEAIAHAKHLRGRALEIAGQPDAAADAYQEATDVATSHELAIEERKFSLEIARIRGDEDRAREILAWFEARGLQHGANLARRAFPRLDGSPSPPLDEPAEPVARLEVLGAMRIVGRNGTAAVRGQKRKEILLHLLEARILERTGVDQLDLVDSLYPGVPEREALANLKQLVFQTRKLFGRDVIVTSARGYALGAIATDAESFLRNGDTSLWRGALGADADSVPTQAREILRHALRERLTSLVGTDPAEAARVAKILLEDDPHDRSSLYLALVAIRRAGNELEVERFYRRSREQFADVGEILPITPRDFLETSGAEFSSQLDPN